MSFGDRGTIDRKRPIAEVEGIQASKARISLQKNLGTEGLVASALCRRRSKSNLRRLLGRSCCESRWRGW
jgi:hypothetical protein